MRVIIGDLWNRVDKYYVVVPINWTCNRNGKAVMGRGVAAQAVNHYPELPSLLGKYIMNQPTLPEVLLHAELALVPVKNHWKDLASIKLIDRSLRELVSRLSDSPYYCYLPLLGAGFGGLEPLTSFTLMASILTSDKYTLVLRDSSVVNRYPKTFKPSYLAQRKDNTL